MLQNESIQILMRMHDLESALGELYACFADKFPEHAGLWTLLSGQEKGHAAAVQRLYQASYEGQTVFESGTIKLEAVQSILDYVKEVQRRTESGKMTAKNALTATYDLENTVLERTIFTHFKVKVQFVDVIQALQKETQKHAFLAKQEMDGLSGADTRKHQERPSQR